MRERDIVEGLVEITLPSPDNFLKVMETLTRVGVVNEGDWLLQVCHILHKKGKYYITHYKELLLLDGKGDDMCEEDYEYRDKISLLLQRWNLIDILYPAALIDDAIVDIKVVPYKEKGDWQLVPRYTMGS